MKSNGTSSSMYSAQDKFELLTIENAKEVRVFFESQFKNVSNWCDLSELESRLTRKGHLHPEIVGVIKKDNKDRVIGAAVAYRNPFSHDQWTLPIIAVHKGNDSVGIVSHRGKGLGRELLQKVFQQVKEKGGKAVLADTNKLASRGGSRGFLESCGFKFLADIPGYFSNEPNEIGLIFIHFP